MAATNTQLKEDFKTLYAKYLINNDIRSIEKSLIALAELGQKDAIMLYLFTVKEMSMDGLSPKVKDIISKISYRDGFDAALIKLAEIYCNDYKTLYILQNGMQATYRCVKNKKTVARDSAIKAYNEYKQKYISSNFVKLAAYIYKFYGGDTFYLYEKKANFIPLYKYISMLKLVEKVPNELLFEDSKLIKKYDKKIREELFLFYDLGTDHSLTLADSILKNYDLFDRKTKAFCYETLKDISARPLSKELIQKCNKENAGSYIKN